MNDEIIDLASAESVAPEERQYTVEQVASMTAVSVTLVRRLVALNAIEAERELFCSRDVARIAQILRLRRDLGVNWIGAGMVLDMSQEIACLKARLRAYESHHSGNN